MVCLKGFEKSVSAWVAVYDAVVPDAASAVTRSAALFVPAFRRTPRSETLNGKICDL
jgi:hypothetical protein